MAISFVESFGWLTDDADIIKKGWLQANSSYHTLVAGGGPFGENSYRMTQGNSSLYRYFATENNKLGISGYFKWSNVITTTSQYWLGFVDPVYGIYCRLGLSGNAITVQQQSTIQITATQNIQRDTWHHVEVIVEPKGVNSKITVWLDGDVLIPETSINQPYLSGCNGIYLGQPGNTTACQIEVASLVLQLGVDTQQLGEARVEYLKPTSNGTYANFTGSDGNSVNNYELVDDVAIDGDTTYVQSNVVNQIDSYGMSNLVTSPSTILAVCPLMYARKTDSGTRKVKPFFRLSSNDYVGATEITLPSSYALLQTIEEVSPATSNAWTEAEVNSAEFGVKITT